MLRNRCAVAGRLHGTKGETGGFISCTNGCQTYAIGATFSFTMTRSAWCGSAAKEAYRRRSNNSDRGSELLSSTRRGKPLLKCKALNAQEQTENYHVEQRIILRINTWTVIIGAVVVHGVDPSKTMSMEVVSSDGTQGRDRHVLDSETAGPQKQILDFEARIRDI